MARRGAGHVRVDPCHPSRASATLRRRGRSSHRDSVLVHRIHLVRHPAALGRMFSDTFVGIAPESVPGFVVAEVIGGALALLVVRGFARVR
jgi:hypothetical protein